MASPDLSFTSASDSTDEDLQDCPVYKNLRERKVNKVKKLDDPEFLSAKLKILDNKFELLEKNKRKLRKDKKETLIWSKELRQMSKDLEGESKELESLGLQHEVIQNTITNLEEEIVGMQNRRDEIKMLMKRKTSVMKNWQSKFAAANPVIKAGRNVFATFESIGEEISEGSKTSIEDTQIV